ncbi:TPA: diguanylate cyclase [Bacillus tropicus]|nr:diguanylate cyclase [Bacillus tropicus]
MYLKNRNYDQMFKQMLQHIEQTTAFSIAMIDIDNFHSYLEGKSSDEVIQNLSQFLSDRLLDRIYYCGKDEFFVISPRKHSEELFFDLTMANRELQNIMNLSFSASIVEFPKNGEELHLLIRLLEEAVYLAKEQGRNRVVFANETKMKLKSNYYTLTQLKRLAELSRKLNRSEASILRESLDDMLRKHEN